MKKRISLFILVAFLFLAIASGCESPATTTPPENAGVTSTSTKVPSTPLPFPSLQMENVLPQTQLATKPSSELAQNRIGAVAATEH